MILIAVASWVRHVEVTSHLQQDEVTQADRPLDRLRIPFGWLEFLSTHEQQRFAEEFFRTARACAAAGNFERLVIEVGNWHETALAYSLGLRDRLASIEYLDEEIAAEDPRAE